MRPLSRLLLVCLLLGGFVSGCANLSNSAYRSLGPYSGGVLLREGIYLQDVWIQPREGKEIHFQGVLKRGSGGISISGVSPFGTTVFRLVDFPSLNSEPKVEIFVEEMKGFQSRFVSFYKGFRPLLLLNDKPSEKNILVNERYFDLRPRTLKASADVILAIEAYDQEGNASKITLQGSQWTARIVLREYKPE